MKDSKGFYVPVLIHPSAYDSKISEIREGTVIESKAIVNAHSIVCEGSIISIGSIVDHDVTVGKCCHVNSGSIAKDGSEIKEYEKLEAGEIVLGYESSRVKQ